jgi:hypothetical protein
MLTGNRHDVDADSECGVRAMIRRPVRSLVAPIAMIATLSQALGALSIADAQPGPPPTIVCSSVSYSQSYCRVDTRFGVRLVERLSRRPCIQGQTWGADPRGIWVSNGCSATFALGHPRGPSGGDDTGAIIVGGLIGAFLGAAVANQHHYDPAPRRGTYYPRRYRDSGYVDNTPQYDRNGNPNFDTHGRYIGPHGLGALVDSPEQRGPQQRDTSQDVDPTVHKFDRNGNPNYDVDGNYIGPHGLGALVDDPDHPQR